MMTMMTPVRAQAPRRAPQDAASVSRREPDGSDNCSGVSRCCGFSHPEGARACFARVTLSAEREDPRNRGDRRSPFRRLSAILKNGEERPDFRECNDKRMGRGRGTEAEVSFAIIARVSSPLIDSHSCVSLRGAAFPGRRSLPGFFVCP